MTIIIEQLQYSNQSKSELNDVNLQTDKHALFDEHRALVLSVHRSILYVMHLLLDISRCSPTEF